MFDQFPVIRISDKYYTMSLRMMKAVWCVWCVTDRFAGPHALDGCRRNTRLRKGFVNLERAPFGGLKLRIPSLLFVEKMRTQNRFNVSGVRVWA